MVPMCHMKGGGLVSESDGPQNDDFLDEILFLMDVPVCVCAMRPFMGGVNR